MTRRLALVAIALSVVGADRLSKQLIDDMSRETLPVDLLGTWARLIYGENHGGLFGLAQGSAPLLAAVIALFALPWQRKVIRGWEDSLMNWRLRRRKQNRALDLGGDEPIF